MINPFYEKLAKLAVNYSVGVKRGDRVFLDGFCFTKELLLALYVEVIKAGGHPLLKPKIDGTEEIFLKYASNEQLLYYDGVMKKLFEEFDCYIMVKTDYNTRRLSLVDPKKLATRQSSPEALEILNIFKVRTTKKELRWVILPFPSNALAQEADMDLFNYTELIEKALFLDNEDPIGEWNKIKNGQEKVVEFLNKKSNFHIIGEDTDLVLSTKGRIWINCCGTENLPDGEVFTSPVEDSVNGYIRFSYPGIYYGKEIENIFLELKDGKVINATADKGRDLLDEILKIENANILGEFAIGTNYGITNFTKNMLFDEKIGGTIHCALGLGLPEAGGTNMSTIHWDLLKNMKLAGSQIYADGKLVYEEGKWRI
ncbi:MAG: aminopeptidase [Promethearchaeota archaeon]|nr:MAG: aminopeptidase [Candidatus Lokiarchaeota archaeon]